MHFLDAIVFIGIPAFTAGAALVWLAPVRSQPTPDLPTRKAHADIGQLLTDVRSIMFDYEEVLRRVEEEVPDYMRPHVAALMVWNGASLVLPEGESDAAQAAAVQSAARTVEGLRRALTDMVAARTDQSADGALAQTACAKRLLNSTRQHFEGRTIELVHLMRLEPRVIDLSNLMTLQGAA